MDQHNRDLYRQESETFREAEADARSFEEAWARAAALDAARIDALLDDTDAALARHEALLDAPADDADRAWWAGENLEGHAEPPAPRYHVEPWAVADGFFRVIDSHGGLVVSTHFGLDCALRTLEVINNPIFGDDVPTDRDPAGEARPGLAGHDDTDHA